MQVLILNEEGEEAEALIVVPALEDVSGERLWRGSFGRFDLGRALHFRVRVKRVEVGAPSSKYSRFRLVPSMGDMWMRPVIKPRPRPPEVRPKPPVRKEVPKFRRPDVKPVAPKPVIGRWGSKFKSSFKFCPYRYYGKLGAFRRVLCDKYDKVYAKKRWMYRVRPKLYKGIAQSHNKVSQILEEPGIAFFPDLKMSILLVGVKNPTSELAAKLRKWILEKGYLDGNLKGQGIEVLCFPIAAIPLPPHLKIPVTLFGLSICLQDLLKLADIFKQEVRTLATQLNLPEGEVFDQISEVFMKIRDCALSSDCDPYDFSPTGDLAQLLTREDWKLLDPVIKSIDSFLIEEKGLPVGEATLWRTWAIVEFSKRVSSKEEARWFLETMGSTAVLGIGLIAAREENGALDPSKLHNSFTSFPYPDIMGFFRALKAMWNNNPELRNDLRYLAYWAVLYGIGDGERAIEGLYRTQATLKLAFRVQNSGWEVLRLSVRPDDDLGFDVEALIDVIAQKDNKTAFIITEPYLGKGVDYNRLIDRIQSSLRFIHGIGRSYWFGRNAEPYLIVTLDAADTNARDQLCSNIESGNIFNDRGIPRYVPIVVIQDGNVVCHSSNISDPAANAICTSLGLCSPSSPDSTIGDNDVTQEDSNSSFSVIGLVAPDPKYCPKGQQPPGIQHQVCIQGISAADD
jgi:hypothetical protein